MTGAVHELLSPAGVGDDLAAGPVDVGRRDPGGRPRPRRRPGWRPPRRQMRACSAVGQLADPHRARHVRAVAVERGAEVQDHEVASADDALRRSVVGLGGVGPRRHDGLERRSRSPPARASRSRGPGRTRPRSDRRPDSAAARPRASSAMRAARSQPGQLPGVLDPAQPLDQRRRWGPAPRPGTTRRRGALLRPGDVGRLEAETADRRRRAAAAASALRRSPRPPRPGRRRPLAPELLGRLDAVAAVGDEHGVGRQHQEQAGRAGEPGQIADVGQAGHDQAVAAGVGRAPRRSRTSRPATSIGRQAGADRVGCAASSGAASRPPRRWPGGIRARRSR